MPLTPPQLFEEFEAGRITREQLHAGLEWHAKTLVEEIIEAHGDPLTSWWEGMLAKRAATRLANRHGVWRVRHILAALSRIPDFEPAHLLWNALHPDVPIHCFFRMRREPIFRINKIHNLKSNQLEVQVRYRTSEGKISEEDYRLSHAPNGLVAEPNPLEK